MALITTTLGELEESTLRKVECTLDNDVEFTTAQEWYLGDELVKREAQVTLKLPVSSNTAIADFG